jgi:hypothetical protein
MSDLSPNAHRSGRRPTTLNFAPPYIIRLRGLDLDPRQAAPTSSEITVTVIGATILGPTLWLQTCLRIRMLRQGDDPSEPMAITLCVCR